MAKAFGATAARAMRTAAGKADSRAKLMGAVRAACTRKGISDEDRKAIQLEVTGKASMTEMELPDFGKLLDHLNRDWKGPMGHRAYIGKAKALWWTLYWLGAIEEPGTTALDAFVKRQTGKSRLQFLGHKEAFSVIEALKGWAGRQGVSWPTAERLAELQGAVPQLTLLQLERHAVLDAIAAELRRLGVLRSSHLAYCEAALHLPHEHLTWSPIELDACIRELGKRLRRQSGKREAEQ